MSDARQGARPQFTAGVEASFVASHAVRLPDGSFEPLHDHRWRVEALFASAQLDSNDMVVDFCEASARLAAIVSAWEGRNLNALPAFAGTTPTAERVAQRIFDALAGVASRTARLARVCVHEAPGCTATYGESP